MKFKTASLLTVSSLIAASLAIGSLLSTTLFAATGSTPFVGFKGIKYYLTLKPADLVGFHGKSVAQAAKTLTPTQVLIACGLQETGASGSEKAAAATSGAATLSLPQGVITSEALTTAAGAAYTLTLTNTLITTDSYVSVEVDNGTNTTAGLAKGIVTPGSGTATILVWNRHASVALNGTIKIRYAIIQ